MKGFFVAEGWRVSTAGALGVSGLAAVSSFSLVQETSASEARVRVSRFIAGLFVIRCSGLIQFDACRNGVGSGGVAIFCGKGDGFLSSDEGFLEEAICSLRDREGVEVGGGALSL